MRFESKTHMAQCLLEGRRFRDEYGCEIFFDPSKSRSPFRYGDEDLDWKWNYFNDEWEEIIPWHKNIPNQGVLCWVWDEEEDVKAIRNVTGYTDYSSYSFRGDDDFGWFHAQPLTREEVEHLILK